MTWLAGPPGRRSRQYGRLLLVLAAAFAAAAPQCASGSDGSQSPVEPSGLEASALLADSAIRVESSGGFAGFVSGASFVAKDGVVSVEYRPAFGRATTEPRTATVTPDVYLSLWKDVAASGLHALPSSGEPDSRGADRIRNVFEVRRGASTTTLIWMDAEAPARPPELPALVETVVGTARKAVGDTRP